MSAALVFAAASLTPTARLRARLATLEHPYVVAADGGAATALHFGITPDLVLGDFDSLDAHTLESLNQRNIATETYPRDKDATDGQLAIERALQAKPSELYLVGFLGGPRLDHALANILLLTRIDVPTVLLDESNECRLLPARSEHTWRPEKPNETISLIPLTEHVSGVRTRGLRWPLDDATLYRGDTRGVSNEPSDDEVSVRIDEGLLLLARHFV